VADAEDLRSYPLTLFFLIAFLVYNDGIQTVITHGQRRTPTSSSASTSPCSADDPAGAVPRLRRRLLLGRIAKRIGAWKTVLLSLVLWTLVVASAYFLPASARAGPTRCRSCCSACLGIVLGGSQALSRSLFSQLIPKGKEGEYFGLYEISDKGTSWLGPLLFGLAYQLTNDYRVAILSLVSFFVIGFFALLAIPMRRAIIAAGNEPPHVL
jgi:UMF1 family MFS transporter